MPPRACRAVLYEADCRGMPELPDGSVDLVVTSPPYWQIKDYGTPGQIGYGQSLHEYLRDLAAVWGECGRALREAGRLCVNIGDQFARASLFGRYHVIPLHAEIIGQCGRAGFDYMGSIIWRKKTTMNTTGGAVVMGSYPYPPNGIVEIDFEYILLFKKPGTSRPPARGARDGAALTRDEWKSWFSGHWDVAGARKKGHDAPFPEEIPRRLIRMFSLPGDTVLDPFLGTGTTARAALSVGRNAVGYEIRADYLAGAAAQARAAGAEVSTLAPHRGPRSVPPPAPPGPDTPRVPDLRAPAPPRPSTPAPRLRTVRAIGDDCSVELETGEVVRLGGLEISDAPAAREYLVRRVLKKKVYLRDEHPGEGRWISARVVLKNRINVNAQLLKLGVARSRDTTGEKNPPAVAGKDNPPAVAGR